MITAELKTKADRVREARSKFKNELKELSEEEGRAVLADAVSTCREEWFTGCPAYKLLGALNGFGPQKLDLSLMRHSLYGRTMEELEDWERDRLVEGLLNGN